MAVCGDWTSKEVMKAEWSPGVRVSSERNGVHRRGGRNTRALLVCPQGRHREETAVYWAERREAASEPTLLAP